MIASLPPALVLFAAALFVPLLRGRLRHVFAVLAPLAALALVWQVPDGVSAGVRFLGYTLQPVEGSGLRRAWATLFLLTLLPALVQVGGAARGRELALGLGLGGAVLMAGFAGDFITLYLAFEVMALCTVGLVWCGRAPEAGAAGLRTAVLLLIAGFVLKLGIEGITHGGPITVHALALDTPPAWLVLAGLLATLAAVPVSAWLADAWPAASPAGTVLLSATGRAALPVVALLFAGEDALLFAGAWMIVHGIVYGAVEDDMRKLLSRALVGQLGVMLVAIGLGSEAALLPYAWGQLAGLTLLFMVAASIIRRTGCHRLAELGGLARQMPFTALAAVIGALAVAALPLTAGHAGLQLILGASAAVPWVQGLLFAAGAGLMWHAGFRFAWQVFFARGGAVAMRPAQAGESAGFAMAMALCLVPGVWPAFHAWLAPSVGVPVLSWGAAGVQIAVALIGVAGYFATRRIPGARQGLAHELDWLWRVALWRLFAALGGMLEAAGRQMSRGQAALGARLGERLGRHLGVKGVLSRAWPIGTTALWIAVLLTGYVIAYFLRA